MKEFLATLMGYTVVGSIAGTVTSVPIPFFEESLTTIGMAIAGSLMAFAYGKSVGSRGKLLGYALGGIFIGIWGLKLMEWQGIEVAYQARPAVAGVLALLSRWSVPFVIENIPELWRRITNQAPAAPGKQEGDV